MALEAVRDVKIRVSVVAGTIEKLDTGGLTAYKGQLDSIVETQKALATLIKTTSEASIAVQKEVTAATKANEELRIKDHNDTLNRNSKADDSYRDTEFAKTRAQTDRIIADMKRRNGGGSGSSGGDMVDAMSESLERMKNATEAFYEEEKSKGREFSDDVKSKFEQAFEAAVLELEKDGEASLSNIEGVRAQLLEQTALYNAEILADAEKTAIAVANAEIKEMERIGKEAEKLFKEEEKAEAKRVKDAEKTAKEVAEAEIKEMERIGKEAEKIFKDEEKAEAKRVKDAEKTAMDVANAEIKEMERIGKEAEKIFKDEEKSAKKKAEDIMKFRVAMNQQRLKQEESDEKAREDIKTDQSKIPKEFQKVQSAVTGTVAGVGTLISHMAMLKSVGGGSLEDMAKKFVKIQSLIGLISSTNNIVKGIKGGLSSLEKMGQLTQSIVTQQQQLGTATSIAAAAQGVNATATTSAAVSSNALATGMTMAQGATMKAAGAAAVLNAAMGPIGIILMGVMAAIAAYEYAMSDSAEASEKAEKKFQEMRRTYNDLLRQSIEIMNSEKRILDSQTEAMQSQWDIKRKIRGEDKQVDLAAAEAESKQMSEQTDRQAESSIDLILDAGLTEGEAGKKYRENRERLETERVKQGQELYDASAKRGESGDYSVLDHVSGVSLFGYAGSNELDERKKTDAINRTDADIASMDRSIGVQQLDELKKTKIKDGVIEDQELFNQRVEALPQTQSETRSKLLANVNDLQTKKQIEMANELDQARKAEERAQQEKKEIEGGGSSKHKALMGEVELAQKYGDTETLSARGTANDAVSRIGNGNLNAMERMRATEEAEKALASQGMLSDGMKAALESGKTADTDQKREEYRERVKKQQEDDSTIDNTEQSAIDKSKKEMEDALKLADANIAVAADMMKAINERMAALLKSNEEVRNLMANSR